MTVPRSSINPYTFSFGKRLISSAATSWAAKEAAVEIPSSKLIWLSVKPKLRSTLLEKLNITA